MAFRISKEDELIDEAVDLEILSPSNNIGGYRLRGGDYELNSKWPIENRILNRLNELKKGKKSFLIYVRCHSFIEFWTHIDKRKHRAAKFLGVDVEKIEGWSAENDVVYNKESKHCSMCKKRFLPKNKVDYYCLDCRRTERFKEYTDYEEYNVLL